MRRTGLPHPSIDALHRQLAGKSVSVLGSARLGADAELLGDDDYVVAVNGGISSVVGNPDVWVVNSRSAQFQQWGPTRVRLATLMLRQGAQKAVPEVVFLAREQEAPPVTLQILRQQGTTVGHWTSISQTDRRYLEYDAGARLDPQAKDALSAGTTAAALCLLAGAAEVRLLGFSWSPGYAYLPGERIDARGHVRADQTALALLRRRYGTRLQHLLTIPPAIEQSLDRGRRP
jgi:hypothetical protein